jgi:hypothetical protein
LVDKNLKPSVGKHRLAADIYVAMVSKFSVTMPTPSDCEALAKASYTYAEAFLKEGDKRQ